MTGDHKEIDSCCDNCSTNNDGYVFPYGSFVEQSNDLFSNSFVEYCSCITDTQESQSLIFDCIRKEEIQRNIQTWGKRVQLHKLLPGVGTAATVQAEGHCRDPHGQGNVGIR